MPKKNNHKSVSVDSVKHKDKRRNIPTEELRDFVKEDELKPKQVKYPGLLYARDPSLDPQLVWKGKDQQDSEELSVPAVPVYIQEKIKPQAIIEDIRAQSKKAKPESQLDLFADFNGIPSFEQMVEFYQHDANWSNRMILGDSFLVMTSLAEKEGLKGKVQMIYIDPPYGIKFGSNWQVSTRKRDVKDGKAEDATRQPEQIRAFRDTWELGIHSYLAYWRDRLIVARELLTETGSIFVQIGDENVHLVRCLMDEVFGSENCVGLITFRTTAPLGEKYLPAITNWLIWYGKDKTQTKFRQLSEEKRFGEGTNYSWIERQDGFRRRMTEAERKRPDLISLDLKIFYPSDLLSSGYTETCTYDFELEGHINKARAKSWRTHETGMKRLILSNRLIYSIDRPCYIAYYQDYPYQPLSNLWDTTRSSIEKIFVVQTDTEIIQRCVLLSTDSGDLVLDPTCGSGTTAFVAEKWGRRWLTIDTSRVALALARTRLMTGRFPYYLLSDSPEGVKKESEVTGLVPPSYQTNKDIKKGFVYKRVPHITLRSIANNEEIDVIYAKYQEKMEPVRKEFNSLVEKNYEEWELPREPQKEWSSKAKDLLKQWWEMRRQRQRQIDESISNKADMELLYDQPYQDNKRIRVTGPLTVESLSPHRTISVEEKKELAEVGSREGWTMKMVGAAQFGNIIIENLKKAGVQNTIKKERLKFDRLDVHAGVWIHAEGEYTEKDGKSRRVGVCIGPEHGTVGPELVKEAAKEAVQGIGYDLLLVCGFAFDPHVSEEAKRYGRLTVLPTRINADLQMGDEFLKKTGAGNLFMVFGEPDIEISKTKDSKIEVEVKGLDIYDPTTGQIRNNSTDDIACWFIDTNYNGESFFVRHAYFTGAGEPYDKLKRALRAEISEEAWSMLYSTKSRPFDPPETGKIAVKVINHYGDEVLKVYDLLAAGQ